jgi:hypothetical protein
MPIPLPALSSNTTNPVGSSTPFKWGSTPPTTIPIPSEELLEYSNLLNSSIQNEEAISSTININGEADKIIQKNSKALGLTGGVNGFYDIDLVQTGAFKGDNVGFDSSRSDLSVKERDREQEPDGFRLYLIAPPKPAVSVATAALGNAAVTLGDYAGNAANTAGNILQNEYAMTAAAVPGATLDVIGVTQNAALNSAQATQEAGKYIQEGGEKVKQIAASIKKYMDEAGANFDTDFKNYVSKAYDEYPDGSAFYSIVLPMPNELFDQHAHEVDQLVMGLAPRLLSGLGTGIDVGGRYGKEAKSRRATGLTVTAFQKLAAATGGIVAEAGAYAKDTARIGLGVGLNPNVEQVYSNPLPRKFQFTFNLPIKSRKEGDLVRDFINRLKQHSYPFSVLGIGGQNNVYLYPGEVYFEFSGRFRNNLYRSLRPCIITSINIAYKNSSDQYQHFEDGSTIEYVISLELTETRLLDRNILVDDADKYANERLTNSQYRNDVRDRDTLFRREIREFGTTGNLPTGNALLEALNPTLGTARGAGQQNGQ